MNYRELKDIVQKNPTCFWTKEQRAKELEYRYKSWVAQQNQQYDTQKIFNQKEST